MTTFAYGGAAHPAGPGTSQRGGLPTHAPLAHAKPAWQVAPFVRSEPPQTSLPVASAAQAPVQQSDVWVQRALGRRQGPAPTSQRCDRCRPQVAQQGAPPRTSSLPPPERHAPAPRVHFCSCGSADAGAALRRPFAARVSFTARTPPPPQVPPLQSSPQQSLARWHVLPAPHRGGTPEVHTRAPLAPTGSQSPLQQSARALQAPAGGTQAPDGMQASATQRAVQQSAFPAQRAPKPVHAALASQTAPSPLGGRSDPFASAALPASSRGAPSSIVSWPHATKRVSARKLAAATRVLIRAPPRVGARLAPRGGRGRRLARRGSRSTATGSGTKAQSMARREGARQTR